MTPKVCYLCRRKRGSTVSFHRIPKDPKTRPAWLAFLKLDETRDNVSSVHIRSGHFTPSDFVEIRGKELQNRLILKPGSVPSILKVQGKAMENVSPEESRTSSIAQNLPEKASMQINVDISQVASCSREIGHEETVQETPKKRKGFEARYIGEIGTPDLASPRRAKRSLNLAKRIIQKQKTKIRMDQQQNRRLVRRIKSLEDLVNNLKKQILISENCADSMVANLPENIKNLISRNLKNKNTKYSPELRRFALTLQFYSTTAYNYVRKTWKNLLPHPSTLRQWYSVVDAKPGFSQEAFAAITTRNKQSQVILNIVIDEMSIRSQTSYSNGKFYGGIDMGTGLFQENDTFREATNALVFMAVSLNAHWNLPLGYFLIEGLNGKERANLLTKCFEILNDTGARVFSITFDGAPSNLAMCTNLGANFNYFASDFKPWFINAVTKEKIWVFLNACHMLKLIRNALGDKKIIIDGKGCKVKWEFIENLYNLQYSEGLHAGTKLTKKHIYFKENRMNVKLAAQTLSESVYNAFIFVHELKISQFEDCMPTAEFCLIFNNIFDLLNCKNKFSKRNKFNIPLDDNSLEFLMTNAKQFENYICGLKDDSGVPILKGNRKTGFLGVIICLRNIFELFEKLKELGQNYLLSFKLSQDYLETFFCCIRARGGFNNNPNARQFENAYKRLLVRHEISNTYASNCLADGVEILHVSSKKKIYSDPVIDNDELQWDLFDHDYVATLWTLTPYVENIVKY